VVVEALAVLAGNANSDSTGEAKLLTFTSAKAGVVMVSWAQLAFKTSASINGTEKNNFIDEQMLQMMQMVQMVQLGN
jgi:hypothetical protein